MQKSSSARTGDAQARSHVASSRTQGTHDERRPEAAPPASNASRCTAHREARAVVSVCVALQRQLRRGRQAAAVAPSNQLTSRAAASRAALCAAKPASRTTMRSLRSTSARVRSGQTAEVQAKVCLSNAARRCRSCSAAASSSSASAAASSNSSNARRSAASWSRQDELQRLVCASAGALLNAASSAATAVDSAASRACNTTPTSQRVRRRSPQRQGTHKQVDACALKLRQHGRPRSRALCRYARGRERLRTCWSTVDQREGKLIGVARLCVDFASSESRPSAFARLLVMHASIGLQAWNE
jgi:hypothetical protein